MKVFHHPLAIDDSEQAALYLEEQVAGLALDFFHELDLRIKQLAEYPQAYPRCKDEIRRVMLRRFKYNVYYRIIENNAIEIIAVCHFRRKPFNFLDRI